MPLHWVREALGEPTEVSNTATAGADEVWLYNSPDRSDAGRNTRQSGSLGPRNAGERCAGGRGASGAGSLLQPGRRTTAPDARATAEVPRAVPELHPAPDLPHAATQAQTAPEAPRALPESHAVADSSRAVTETSHATQESPKISESRHGVMRGQDCKQALAELGPPDRQRDVPALDSASGPTTEYIYEPAGSADPTRTRVVCANGKVEGVDRTVIR